jgi:uncharacterized protein
MRARIMILIVLLCAVVAASALPGCVTTQKSTQNNTSANTSSTAPAYYRVTVGNITVYAEAADTPAKRETGLMNRTSLNENAGMLFVFPTEQPQSFWMKNMRIPLDIVYITADMRVLQIYQSVPPCTGDPCVLYTASAPIKYVLEVNSGFSERNGIKSGDTVLIAPLS